MSAFSSRSSRPGPLGGRVLSTLSRPRRGSAAASAHAPKASFAVALNIGLVGWQPASRPLKDGADISGLWLDRGNAWQPGCQSAIPAPMGFSRAWCKSPSRGLVISAAHSGTIGTNGQSAGEACDDPKAARSPARPVKDAEHVQPAVCIAYQRVWRRLHSTRPPLSRPPERTIAALRRRIDCNVSAPGPMNCGSARGRSRKLHEVSITRRQKLVS